MDFILDVLVYGIFDFLGESFLFLFTAFIPSRNMSIKTYRVLYVVGIVFFAILFIGLILGITLLVENKAKSVFGWILISLTVMYLLIGIIFKLIYKDE